MMKRSPLAPHDQPGQDALTQAFAGRVRRLNPGFSRRQTFSQALLAMEEAAAGRRALLVSSEGNESRQLLLLGRDASGEFGIRPLRDPGWNTRLNEVLVRGAETLLPAQYAAPFADGPNLHDDGICLAAIQSGDYFQGFAGYSGIAAGGSEGLSQVEGQAARVKATANLLKGAVPLIARFFLQASWMDEASALAMLEERMQIGSDLHDTLLQDLSYLKLQLGRLERIDPSPADQALAIRGNIVDHLVATSREAREMLFALQTGGSLTNNLPREASLLLQRVGEHSNMAIPLEVRGPVRKLGYWVTAQVLFALLAIISGAIQRGNASSIAVALIFADDGLVAKITDDATPIPADEMETSTPVKAVRRRLSAIGATVSIESAPERTCLEIRAPL